MVVSCSIRRLEKSRCPGFYIDGLPRRKPIAFVDYLIDDGDLMIRRKPDYLLTDEDLDLRTLT